MNRSRRPLMMKKAATLTLALMSFIAASFATSEAHAGGFYFTDRGARQLGRGYAFVAGADDGEALWYNPAGISFADHQLYIDAQMTLLHADYTRVDSGGNVQPTVSAENAPIPIPTIAYINDFGLDNFTFALGAMAPSGLITDWPAEVGQGQNRSPSPQRYSLVSMAGTMFLDIVFAASWQPIEELSIGLAGHIAIGGFRGRVVSSGCDGALCTQAENPEYDAMHELAQDTTAAFTASAGIIYDAGPVRIGASVMLPFQLRGGADLRVQLPEAAIFDDAYIEGDRIGMKLEFPLVLRAGIEARPVDGLRVEAAFVYERWSTQQSIAFDPRDVWIRNVATLGDYQVGPIEIPRNMRDVFSARLGMEYTIPNRRLTLRTGVMYENSAFPNSHLTVMTLDSDKVILGLGVGVQVSDGIRLDVSYGHSFLRDRNVTNSEVPVPNAIRPGVSEENRAYAGNGRYNMEADIFALGFTWDID